MQPGVSLSCSSTDANATPKAVLRALTFLIAAAPNVKGQAVAASSPPSQRTAARPSPDF